jgi:hypothetical protein
VSIIEDKKNEIITLIKEEKFDNIEGIIKMIKPSIFDYNLSVYARDCLKPVMNELISKTADHKTSKEAHKLLRLITDI